MRWPAPSVTLQAYASPRSARFSLSMLPAPRSAHSSLVPPWMFSVSPGSSPLDSSPHALACARGLPLLSLPLPALAPLRRALRTPPRSGGGSSSYTGWVLASVWPAPSVLPRVPALLPAARRPALRLADSDSERQELCQCDNPSGSTRRADFPLAWTRTACSPAPPHWLRQCGGNFLVPVACGAVTLVPFLE